MGTSTKMKAGVSQAPTVHIKKFFAAAKKQVAAAKGGDIRKTGSRLYVKGVVAGYRRALTKQKTCTSLIKIQGVDETKDVASTRARRSCTCTVPRLSRMAPASVSSGARS